jgi:hypothetical protein
VFVVGRFSRNAVDLDEAIKSHFFSFLVTKTSPELHGDRFAWVKHIPEFNCIFYNFEDNISNTPRWRRSAMQVKR